MNNFLLFCVLVMLCSLLTLMMVFGMILAGVVLWSWNWWVLVGGMAGMWLSCGVALFTILRKRH